MKNTRKALRNLAGPCLAVNAVAQASIRQRQYPLDKLARALEELLADGTISSVVLLGDQYSRSNHGPLTRVLGARCLDLSGMLSLGVSAAIMRECDAVLTIDGGLLHIALCTSLPVAVLYGPTDVYRTDPRAAINCYRVVSAFDSCRCDYRNHQGIRVRPECRKESQCLAAIPPDVIKNAVASLQPFSADTGKKRAMEQ